MTSNRPRQVGRGAEPVLGESLRGLVSDTCAANRIANTWGMLQYFGLPHRNRVDVSESAHLDISGLATALRIDKREVEKRRYPPDTGSNRRFNGVIVPISRIEDRVRRFSPAAIAAGALHHPATHELRDLPFSTVGWDLLQSTCPCEAKGVIQRWTRCNRTHRCDRCGGRLDRISPIPIAKAIQAPLQLIAGLVDGDALVQAEALELLPVAIRHAGRSFLYNTIINLTRCIVASDDADPLAKTNAMASACEAIMQWPIGLTNTVPGKSCPTYLWETLRRNYTVLGSCNEKWVAGNSTSQGTMESLNIDQGLPSARGIYRPNGTSVRVSTDLLGAMAAARLSGVDETALKEAWDDERLTQHFWVMGGERVRAFDSDEVVALAPRLRVAKARALAGKMLGIPVYGIEQLLSVKLVTPGSPTRQSKHALLYRNAFQGLIDRLDNVVTDDIPDPVLLIEAVRNVSGRPKPWAAVIAALLHRQIPFKYVAMPNRKPLVRRLNVSAAAVPAIVAMAIDEESLRTIDVASRWSQADSLECLNGYKSTVGPLAGLDVIGTRPKTYLANDVLTRCALGITTSDLARRSRTDVKRLFRILEGRVPQIAPLFWDRDKAEDLMHSQLKLRREDDPHKPF